MSSNLRKSVLSVVLVALSILSGILLCEAASRFLLNPADYLSAAMVKDDILGITIPPNRAGYDEWGFRNSEVPLQSDIVAIGDSHTYGNTAAMGDAWPAVLSRVANMRVYNLGLGGYGPNQYYHLLLTKGLRLHPKWVICGLYFGDDFENAFSITYGLDYWSHLRKGRYDSVDHDIWNPESPVWGSNVRNWLSKHSMVYRIVFHGPFVSTIKEYIRFKEVSENRDPYTTSLVIDEGNIREAFRPLGVAESLNQSSAPIREGMRITFQILQEMDNVCLQAGCQLVVVLIPTKETVFSDYIEGNAGLHLLDVLERLIKEEREAKHELIEFLDSAGIRYVDTLPALKRNVGDNIYAVTTRDMHPSKNGYRVIGEAVAEYLSSVRSVQ